MFAQDIIKCLVDNYEISYTLAAKLTRDEKIFIDGETGKSKAITVAIFLAEMYSVSPKSPVKV